MKREQLMSTETFNNTNFEKERNKKIENYLIENLPESEERIKTEMDSNCEVSVVIPAYGERDFILRPLESLAEQEDVNSNQYEVVIVVNNPEEEPDRVLNETDDDYRRKIEHFNKAIKENQETLNLIKYINGENIEEDVLMEFFKKLSEKEKEIIKKIQNSGLKLFAIDKCSSGKNLPDDEANVGGARNRGVAEAVERFYKQKGKNGIIAQSDADTQMDKCYVRNLIETFQQNPDLVGLTGKLNFEASSDELIKTINQRKDAMYRYEGLIKQIFDQRDESDQKEKAFLRQEKFSGANMASRAFEAALVGGVPKRAGGEDPAFGKRLSLIGQIEKIEKIEVTTADRFSARTAVDCGHGQENIKRKNEIDENKEIYVTSPEFIKFLQETRKNVNELVEKNNQKSEEGKKISSENLKEILSINDECIVDDSEIELISDRLNNITNIFEFGGDRECASLSIKMNRKISEVIPDISIGEGINFLKNIILDADDARDIYKTNKREINKKVREGIDERVKIFELLLDIIFDNKPDEINNNFIIRTIKSNKDKIGLTEERIKLVEENNKILNFITEAAQSKTKEEALEKLKISFKEDLTMPEDNSMLMTLMELEALKQTLLFKNNQGTPKSL